MYSNLDQSWFIGGSRGFAPSFLIDAVEGVALAIREVGARVRQLATSDLNS